MLRTAGVIGALELKRRTLRCAAIHNGGIACCTVCILRPSASPSITELLNGQDFFDGLDVVVQRFAAFNLEVPDDKGR
jgi:hypothetical protein